MPDFPPLYLLRHGQTTWNRDRRIQGQLNSELTELGRQHARRQGEILAGLDLPAGLTAYCSPARRTRQTAGIAFAPLGFVPVFDDRLKEIHLGSWEGHMRADIEARMPQAFTGSEGFRSWLLSDGESETDLRIRIGAFLANLTGPAVVVSHGIALTFLRGVVLDATMEDMAAMKREQGVVIELRNGAETTHR